MILGTFLSNIIYAIITDRLYHFIRDEKLPIYGNCINIRDCLYVEDHCKAIDIILNQGKKGERYNISGHNERRKIEIVKLILERLGK